MWVLQVIYLSDFKNIVKEFTQILILTTEDVFYAIFTSIEIAIEKEKQIKKWSRAKKLALIEGRFEDLPNLAKKKF